MKKLLLLLLFVFLVGSCFAQNLIVQEENVVIPEQLPTISKIVSEENDKESIEQYAKNIEQKIRNNWNVEDADIRNNAYVNIEISKDGKLINKDVAFSLSRDSKYTNQIFDAIDKSAPFDSLEDKISNFIETVTLRYSFEGNNVSYVGYHYTRLKSLNNFWGPYMRDLEQRIKRNWVPPKEDASKRIVVTFTIAKDGKLIDNKITKSSGVPLADKAALEAIEKTAPFRPLPEEFKGYSVPIEFTFDYNVLKSFPTLDSLKKTFEGHGE